jgi:hypothetical protein
MEGNDVKKLRMLNALFDRVAGLPKLVNAFKSFVNVGHTPTAAHMFLTYSYAKVADIVCDISKDEEMVE